MIIKCLVLTFAFFFISVQASEEKTEAAYFEMGFDKSVNLTQSGNTFSMTSDYISYAYVRYYVATTNNLANIRKISVGSQSWSISTVAKKEYVNIVFMTRQGVYDCGYSSSSVCSSAPSGFSETGATLLVSFALLNNLKGYQVSVGGGGQYLFKDYSASAINVTVKDAAPPTITNVTVTNSSSGNWTNQDVTIKASGATDKVTDGAGGTSLMKYYFTTSTTV